MAVPYTFATATSSIPLSQLDANFATGITLGNTTVYLGNTTTSIGNLTLTNVTISSVASTFPNSYLANSSVTIGSTNVSLGGTATTIAGLTLTSPTITGGTSTATQNLANVTGTLAVGNGGTGLTSLTAGYIPYGNGTSAFSSASTLSYSSTSGLTVNGITQAYNTNLYNVDGTLSSYASNNSVYLNGNAGGALQLRGDGTGSQQIVLRGGSSSYISINTASAEAMRIDSSGNVGIGTSSPTGAKVQISGFNCLTKYDNTNAGNAIYQNFYAGADRAYIGIESSTGTGIIGSGAAYALNIVTASTNPIVFGTNSTEQMRLDSSGNLGLGVTPSAWQSGFKALESSSGNSWYATSGASALASNTYFNGGWIYKKTSTAGLYANAQGVHQWFTAPSGTAGNAITFTQAMTLDNSGNLFVGTTSSGIGTARGNFWSDGTNSCINLASTGNGASEPALKIYSTAASGATNAIMLQFLNSGASIVGSITSNGTATIYNTTSDYRLKTVVGSISDAGQRIDYLEPIEYDWKDGGRTRGFLAHKFAEVYPNSVTGEKDAIDAEGKPIYQSMQASSSEVMADLIAEIQSLRKRVALLESK